MKQRGRKSPGSNVISIAAIGMRPTLSPSKPLTKPEKQIWDLTVKDHQHLRRMDAPLLTCYVVAVIKTLTAKYAKDFDTYSRAATSLATKLRLSPQASMRAETVGRRYERSEDGGGRRPWDRDDEDEDKGA